VKRILAIVPTMLVLVLLVLSNPISSHAQPPAALADIPTALEAEESPLMTADAEDEHPIRDSGIGCATGAALGSVFPGLGTVVGCLVGGVAGWWMS